MYCTYVYVFDDVRMYIFNMPEIISGENTVTVQVKATFRDVCLPVYIEHSQHGHDEDDEGEGEELRSHT